MLAAAASVPNTACSAPSPCVLSSSRSQTNKARLNFPASANFFRRWTAMNVLPLPVAMVSNTRLPPAVIFSNAARLLRLGNSVVDFRRPGKAVAWVGCF